MLNEMNIYDQIKLYGFIQFTGPHDSILEVKFQNGVWSEIGLNSVHPVHSLKFLMDKIQVEVLYVES